MAKRAITLVRAAVVALALLMATGAPGVAQSTGDVSAFLGWPPADQRSGARQLMRTAAHLPRMPDAAADATLAARVSEEGQWTFINMAGEIFTAANAGEIKRGLDILLPDLGARRMLVVLTIDSIAERGKLLAQLPMTADLALGWGDETFKVTRAGGDQRDAFWAELKPSLLIELTSASAFAEAMHMLRRPLAREGFRVVSLTPGGPRAFSSMPRLDRATGKAEIDAIDPAYLATALGGLRGQTAVLTGRVGAGTLTFTPASGAEQTIGIDGLSAAAAAGDANLLVLKASSTQQPGGRNWLWQRVEVKGLESALGHATLADVFVALGDAGGRLVLRVEQPSALRTALDLSPVAEGLSVSSTTAKLGTAVSDAVSGLAGNVTHQGAVANFASTGRQVELERRLLPYIPSAVQWLYAGLWLLGLLGAARSWRWWRKVWPSEKAADYPNTFGFWAARGARGLFYALVFLPMSAIAAAPLTCVSLVGGIVRRPKLLAAIKAKATET